MCVYPGYESSSVVDTIGTFAFRIVSSCGITALSDELVQRMTMSGFADFSAFFASPDTFTPSRLPSPMTSPMSRPAFADTNDPTLVIKELDGGARLVVDLSDHVIGLNIVRGRYEADEVALMGRVVSAGDTALDVGAHIGFFSMQMAALVGPRGRVY